MTNVKLDEGLIRGDSVASILDFAMDGSGGLLRFTATWVPGSFLRPGRRITFPPGNIDQRCFGRTTDAADDVVEIQNPGNESRFGLRYFGPNTYDNLTKAGSSSFRLPSEINRQTQNSRALPLLTNNDF